MIVSADNTLRQQAEEDDAREQRWIKLYSELTGASDATARACWMYEADRNGHEQQSKHFLATDQTQMKHG